MEDKWQHKGGTGRWKEWVNSDTGESSLKTHALKTVYQSCPTDQCHFELTNSAARECTCVKCGRIEHFIVGLQALIDGKIVTVR